MDPEARNAYREQPRKERLAEVVRRIPAANAKREVFIKEHAVALRQGHPSHPRFALTTEDIGECGPQQLRVSIKHRVDTIAHHGARAGQPSALTHDVLALPYVPPWHVDPRHKVASQQGSQCRRIDPVVFDLRIGNDPVLRRARHHNASHPGRLLQQIVQHAPVPARLDHHSAW